MSITSVSSQTAPFRPSPGSPDDLQGVFMGGSGRIYRELARGRAQGGSVGSQS